MRGFGGTAPWWGAAVATAVVVPFAVAAIRDADGHPVPPLDDVYIHFQYARSIAEGHPFAYHPGEAPSSGASSPLYVALLALPYAVGVRGHSLYLFAWAIAWASVFVVFLSLSRLIWRYSRKRLSPALALLLVGWGWFGWHAASGMETVLATAGISVAWVLVVEWSFRGRAARTLPRAFLLLGVAFLMPLLRPSAIGFSFAIALAFLLQPPARPRGKFLGRGLFFALGTLATTSDRWFWWIVSGRTSTNGADAKWLFATTLPMGEMRTWVENNASGVGHFLIGEPTPDRLVYLPAYAAAGLLALAFVQALAAPGRRGRWTRRLLFGGALAGLLVLFSYTTLLGHRFRYLMPHLPALFALGLAGQVYLSRWLAAQFAVMRPRWTPASAVLWALPFALTWTDAHWDFHLATNNIAHVHIPMAARVRELPANARVAVTDAGAIAYLGERPTVDVVGLTTNGAALPYRAGGGAQLEFIATMPPTSRPDFAVTFADNSWWFPLRVLGENTVARVRYYAVIAGGYEMTLRELRYERLAAPPASLGSVAPLDTLNIADLRSEQRHQYRNEMLRSDTTMEFGADREVDGCRRFGGRESFRLAGRPGQPLRIVYRFVRRGDESVTLQVNGGVVHRVELAASGWTEGAICVESARTANRVVVDGLAVSCGYWSQRVPSCRMD